MENLPELKWHNFSAGLCLPFFTSAFICTIAQGIWAQSSCVCQLETCDQEMAVVNFLREEPKKKGKRMIYIPG